MDTLRYWMEVVLALCGIDASASVPGIVAVLSAFVVLVFAAWRAVACSFWPGETDARHIKYRILADEEDCDAR